MPNYVPVTKENHASKRWKRIESYSFAAKEVFLPLVVAELPKAVTTFPIAFTQQHDTFVLVALLSFEQGRNLFVADSGQWVGTYVPSILRGYPFMLARTQDSQLVLCVDQDSGRITDGPDGEAFFDETGQPSAPVKQLLDFLQKVDANSQATAQMSATLAKHNVIKPWPITVKTPSGDRNIEGLFQIDEQALNSLPDDAFLQLRKSGALPMAYCQLLSMQHLATLGKLVDLHAHAGSQQSQSPKASIEFDDDMIKFQ